MRQGVRPNTGAKIFKAKLSLNSADTPDGSPLGAKLVYMDLSFRHTDVGAVTRGVTAVYAHCRGPNFGAVTRGTTAASDLDPPAVTPDRTRAHMGAGDVKGAMVSRWTKKLLQQLVPDQ